MNVQEELKKRFEEIVKEMIKPPVLFGPKWLQSGPASGQYQFLGAPRIAKATGRNVERVARGILRQLRVGDLRLSARVTPSGVITLSPAQPKARKPAAGPQEPTDAPADESP